MIIAGKEYLLVTLDFETHFAPKYTLTAMNTFTYVADPRFSIHGVGVKIEAEKTQWYRDTRTALDAIEKRAGGLPIAMVCHNTYFDGWILHTKFDWHPDLYLDTMGMSRGLFPTGSASLEKLAERLWPNNNKMRKGKELVTFKGVTTEALWANKGMEQTMARYCVQDCDLTFAAFEKMFAFYPDEELALIDLTLQFHCKPMLMIDVPRVQECMDNAIRDRDELIRLSGIAESTLSSNTKFEQWMIKHGIPVPKKDSPSVVDEDGDAAQIAAFGKTDIAFLELRATYPAWEHVWAARVAAKSVGELTRAQRFLETAEQCDGFMPVPLRYYGAHTGRYGGCLAADTLVSVYNHHTGLGDKYITEVTEDDLVWDGDEYVPHEGVICSGLREVITYDGITGTPEHVVFTSTGGEKPLAQARADGDCLAFRPSPAEYQLALALPQRGDNHQVP